MEIRPTAIPDVVEITPRRIGDARGYFSETYNLSTFKAAGILQDWVQDNVALSADVGVLRGLHCQTPPMAQAKLVRVLRGRIFDVAVDVRTGSPHYGRWVGVELSAEAGNQLLVPVGFLHGYVTLEPMSEVMYKVSAHYAPEHDRAVRFDDPAIGVVWPLGGRTPILSPKDIAARLLSELGDVFPYQP